MNIRQVNQQLGLDMNCSDFEANIDAFLADSIDETTRKSMLQHKAKCASCENSYQQHIAYLSLLSGWQEPKLGEQRKNELLSALAKRSEAAAVAPARSLKSFAGGFAAASILGIALFIGNQAYKEQEQVDLSSIFEHEEYTSREITLVINVPKDMPDAQLHFQLPAELSIVGREHQTKVNLPVDLKSGENTVVIPLEVEDFAHYTDKLVVNATLIYKNSKKDFALDLAQHLDLDAPQNDSDELIFIEQAAIKTKTV